MKQLILSLGVAGLVTAATPASAACSLSKMFFNLGQRTTQQIQIGTGEYCSGELKFPKTKITQVVVMEQPRNGLVRVEEKTNVWKYRPFKNFRGNDRFVLRIYATNDKIYSDGIMVFDIKVQ